MKFLNPTLRSIAAVLFFAAGSAEAASPIEPGLWEVTIKTEMKGTGPTTTEQICISKDQAEHLEPAKSKKSADCQVVSGGLTGNRSKYQIKCGSKNATSDVEFTYSGDHYEGVITIKNDDIGEIRQVYTARRISECDQEKE